MIQIVITSVVCLTILGFNIITKDLNLKKIEALKSLSEIIINNSDKFNDNDDVTSLLLQIKSSLD